MRLSAIAIAASLAGLTASAAYGQTDERYTLERSGEGFVRMDTRTGSVSYCEEASSQMVCRTAADERMAYQDRLDELEERVAALEARLAEGSLGLSSDEEFEQSLGRMQQFFQSFFDIVEEWEKDLRGEEPGAESSQPDRT